MSPERTRRLALRLVARARRDPTPILAAMLALGILLMVLHWWGAPSARTAPESRAAHHAEVVTEPRAPRRGRRTSRRAPRGGAAR